MRPGDLTLTRPVDAADITAIDRIFAADTARAFVCPLFMKGRRLARHQRLTGQLRARGKDGHPQGAGEPVGRRPGVERELAVVDDVTDEPIRAGRVSPAFKLTASTVQRFLKTGEA